MWFWFPVLLSALQYHTSAAQMTKKHAGWLFAGGSKGKCHSLSCFGVGMSRLTDLSYVFLPVCLLFFGENWEIEIRTGHLHLQESSLCMNLLSSHNLIKI